MNWKRYETIAACLSSNSTYTWIYSW